MDMGPLFSEFSFSVRDLQKPHATTLAAAASPGAMELLLVGGGPVSPGSVVEVGLDTLTFRKETRVVGPTEDLWVHEAGRHVLVEFDPSMLPLEQHHAVGQLVVVHRHPRLVRPFDVVGACPECGLISTHLLGEREVIAAVTSGDTVSWVGRGCLACGYAWKETS